MTADIGECGESLRMLSAGVLGIATRIAIKVEEERKLDRDVVAGSPTVPRTKTSMAPRGIDIDRVITIGDRSDIMCRQSCAYFLQNWRRAVPVFGSIGEINDGPEIGAGAGHCAGRVRIFVAGCGISTTA